MKSTAIDPSVIGADVYRHIPVPHVFTSEPAAIAAIKANACRRRGAGLAGLGPRGGMEEVYQGAAPGT